MKTSCEWYCNFTFPKSAYQVKCTTLKGVHNHEISSSQVYHFIARYRRLSDEMIQDLKFFMDCKVAPITQLEILKKKYPGHVFHKQDIYNAIYKLRQNNDDNLDSTYYLMSSLKKYHLIRDGKFLFVMLAMNVVCLEFSGCHQLNKSYIKDFQTWF